MNNMFTYIDYYKDYTFNEISFNDIDALIFASLVYIPIMKLSNKKLKEIGDSIYTTIIYVAPHKLNSTLKDLKEILEDRQIVLAREITKIHEEFIRGNINDICEKAQNLKGEIVLIIEGSKEEPKEENELNSLTLEEHYKFYEAQGFTKKDIIKKIAKDRNLNKNEVYQHFI